MARSNEPAVWSLFAAGGMVAALFVPVHLLVLFLLVPLGVVKAPSYASLHDLFAHPLSRVYLAVLISLPLFHWAHRFRYTLVDMGLRRAKTLLAVVCYGAALAGTVCGVLAVFSL